MTRDKDRTPVAQNVIAVCTKCKLELNHVVVSHNMAGIVERVKCHTCGTEHKYRSEKKKESKKSLKNPKKGTRTRKVDVSRDFEKLAERFKEKVPVPYTMSGSFESDDVIDHKTFGMGIVIRVSYQKMEVAFHGGPRILACNR